MLTSSIYADVISFFVTKKCQKIRKIDENSYWRSHKKAELHPLFRIYVFGKTTGGPPPPQPFKGWGFLSLLTEWKISKKKGRNEKLCYRAFIGLCRLFLQTGFLKILYVLIDRKTRPSICFSTLCRIF